MLGCRDTKKNNINNYLTNIITYSLYFIGCLDCAFLKSLVMQHKIQFKKLCNGRL
jgi:hypothetical protein